MSKDIVLVPGRLRGGQPSSTASSSGVFGGLLLVLVLGGRAVALEAQHVVLVSIDGLRVDALSDARTPAIVSLAELGAASYEARNHAPTFTVPNHVSMLTGLSPEAHGVVDPPRELAAESVATLVKRHGGTVGFYISKDKLAFLAGGSDYEREFVDDTGSSHAAVDAFVTDFASEESRWWLSVLHVVEPDAVGHRHRWMSVEYLAAVKDADRHVARIISAVAEAGMSEETVVIVTSDHGGKEYEHSEDTEEVTTVPWIVVGPGVTRGRVNSPVRLVDTASTVLAALGIAVPSEFEGHVPAELTNAPFIRGDVDGSARLSISDAVAVLEYLFRARPLGCLEAADVDSDRRISLTDAVFLLNHVFRGGGGPAAPYPDCGTERVFENGCAASFCP